MFCLLAGFPKATLLTMTIFALISQKELQHAFQCISQMISPDRILQSMLSGASPVSYSFHGSMINARIGLNVHLVRCSSTGAAKCLGVTLIRDPTSSGNVLAPATAADMVSVPALSTQPPSVSSHPLLHLRPPPPSSSPSSSS